MVEPELIPEEVAEQFSVAGVGSWKLGRFWRACLHHRDYRPCAPTGALMGAYVAAPVGADEVAVHATRS